MGLFSLTVGWVYRICRGSFSTLSKMSVRQASSSAAAVDKPQLCLPAPPQPSTSLSTLTTASTLTASVTTRTERSSVSSSSSSSSPTSLPTSTDNMAAKAEQSLRKTLTTLSSASPTSEKTTSLLTSAKRDLLTLNALIPSPSTPPAHLSLARSVLETGALLSIRAQNPDAFTRYYQQLQAFYDLSPSAYGKGGDGEGQRGKVTGLYLLLLLTKGDYAGFHTVLEGLETQGRGVGVDGIGGTAKTGKDADRFVRYPVMLEQWLMEGAYDRVWAATKREGVPSEEFGVFHEVLVGTIRAEIASCSEKAYPSIPVSNAKNLLFLESEGSVVKFAEERGWVVKDGRIYFPQQGDDGAVGGRSEKDILVASGTVIENTIGYARELETIV